MYAQRMVVVNDPVDVYTAAENLEARLVSSHLNDAGIAATVVEDRSPVGVSKLG